MAMWYNLSAVRANTVLELMQSTDSLFFFHMFSSFILIALFVIIFRAVVTFNGNPKVSFMYSAFFIAVISILLKLLNLANDYTVFLAWGILAISVALQFLLD
jgi:hypothetical protein